MAEGCILNTAENRLKIREMTYYRDVSKIKFEMALQSVWHLDR